MHRGIEGSARWVALSPFGLIGVCAAIQWIAGQHLGAWAWVPTMLGFWLMIGLMLRRHYGWARLRERFGRATGSPLWSVLAVLVGLLSLPGFLGHWSLLASGTLVATWLVFSLINPWLEEAYWRGLLMDATATWGKAASLLYPALCFTISHPLVWGIHSLPLRKPEAVAAIFFVGLIWGLAYQRTGSLRWCVLGHMLANLFGLAVLVMLNLHDPTVRMGAAP